MINFKSGLMIVGVYGVMLMALIIGGDANE